MGEIKIGRMVMGVCQTNCYFLYRDGAQECVVVDPADQGTRIYDALQKNGFRVAGILLTHGHFDHIWGLDALRNAVNGAAEADGTEQVKAYAHEAERELLRDVHKNVSEQAGRPCSTFADEYVKDGQKLCLAGMDFQVIATPGMLLLCSGGRYPAGRGYAVCGVRGKNGFSHGKHGNAGEIHKGQAVCPAG